MGYLHQEIEKKWQKYWVKNQTFFTNLLDTSKPKKYILAMFPYPSGSGLHVGHIRNYTITDALARFYRLNGYNVLMPIGWDAFGLPAEQYAIQTGNHPAIFTQKNIENYKKQLLGLGFSYDWSKEIDTSQANYYHWTQWIFCQIYRQGLAEHKEIPVYWCEKLGTVLANEEIKNIAGKKVSERGNFPVIEKKVPQWVLKITQYAPLLLADLEKLDWPNSIKSLQKNWIGLTKGTIINFPAVEKNLTIPVFTTRPDTIYGVVAIALSINHPLISEIILPEYQKKVADFCEYWKNIDKNISNPHLLKEKKQNIEGVFAGSYCFNPINQERMPIWIANFIVSDYGTGAVMVCPNCNQKDEVFADKYISDWYPRKKIIHFLPEYLAKLTDYKPGKSDNLLSFMEFIGKVADSIRIETETLKCYEGPIDGICKYINSPLIEKITNQKEAAEIINNHLESTKTGKKTEIYHLRDWVFSRQRYWGEPIPVIHWENNQKELLPENDLPLILPPLTDFAPNPNYYAPLQKAEKWVKVEKNGLKGKRDVNVMPQWAGSCWYYIAFLLKKNETYLAIDSQEAQEIIKNWLPVDIYIGGQEHANLHLLYARFWHKILHKIGIVNYSEPFQKFFPQGMILGTDGEKMSKSRGNVVNPDELVEKYGADALRLYEIFLGPPEQTTKFDPNGVRATKKWLDRVYNLFTSHRAKFTTNSVNNEDKQLKVCYQKTVKKVSDYYQSFKFNLVVSSLMTFINECYKSNAIPIDYALAFCQLLNPLAPHISEELWSYFQEKPISESSWPQVEEVSILSSQINIVVQINGQKKLVISLNQEKKQSEIETIAKSDPKISKILGEQKIIKTIFIKNKLINFVI